MDDTRALRTEAVPGRPVTDPACWTADELAARADDWILALSEAEISHLEGMATAIQARIGDDPNGLLALSRDDFDLGPFAATVDRALEILKDGVGLALIRGLPVARWGKLASAIVYWAMGRHIGLAQPNNPQGDMFGHIADMGRDYDNPLHRGYQTNVTMAFHVDPPDVLTLLCLQTAKSGGRSSLVSSVLLHNEMLARRPDLVEELGYAFYRSRHGEMGPGQAPYYRAAVFDFPDGMLSVSAGAKHVEKGHALPEAPDLTATQKEALKMFADIAQEIAFETDLQAGDIPLLNSHVTLHTRNAFEDFPERERRRHLWRLWLRVDGFRPRSAYFENWVDGVWAPEAARNITLEAWPA
jgi:hypothetical protein